MLVNISYITTNARPACARRYAPDKYYMLYARISYVYSLVSIDTLSQTLKAFVEYIYKFQVVSLHDRTNFRIFSDGKLFNRRMMYINTVRYYWWKMCRDGKCIRSVIFLTLVYLKYQQRESL